MILTKEEEDYSAVEGKGVMMHCNVFSSPPSSITWYVHRVVLVSYRPAESSRSQLVDPQNFYTLCVVRLLFF